MNSCAVCCCWPSPKAQWVKNLPAMQKTQEFDPWVEKIPRRRKRQPTPVFLSVKSHGQRSSWGGKELDTIEQLTTWRCCIVAQSCLTLCSPRTVAHQAPLSLRFPRQEYWRGLPFPSPGVFPTQGLNPCLLHCRRILYHWDTREVPMLQFFKKERNTLLWPQVLSLYCLLFFFTPTCFFIFPQIFIESLFCGGQVLGVHWGYTDLTLSSQILDKWRRPVSKYSRVG